MRLASRPGVGDAAQIGDRCIDIEALAALQGRPGPVSARSHLHSRAGHDRQPVAGPPCGRFRYRPASVRDGSTNSDVSIAPSLRCSY
jgi:hypothetical protein